MKAFIGIGNDLARFIFSSLSFEDESVARSIRV